MICGYNLTNRKLLIVNYEFPPLGGGAGTATFNLARWWAKCGAEVTVLTTRFRGQPEIEQMHGFTVMRIPSLRRQVDRSSVIEMLAFMVSALIHARPIARRTRAEAAITFFGLPCGPVGYLLRKTMGIPYIVSLRGGDVPGYMPASLSLYHRTTSFLSRIVWRSALAVIANSSGLAELAGKFAKDLTIGIIPNGVDTELFHPPAMRQGGGIVSIMTVGRLHHQKGNDILLQAFAALNEADRKDCRLVIVGDGPAKPQLQDMATALGIAEKVDFRGWIDHSQLPDLYRQADIFAFPSREEGMPNVVLEAMASGLPVVASGISGIPLAVEDGRTGRLVPEKEPEKLLAALLELLEDPGQARAMGEAGRRKAETELTWDAVTARYREGYVTALSMPV